MSLSKIPQAGVVGRGAAPKGDEPGVRGANGGAAACGEPCRSVRRSCWWAQTRDIKIKGQNAMRVDLCAAEVLIDLSQWSTTTRPWWHRRWLDAEVRDEVGEKESIAF